jgi:hypothetical protein
MRHDDHGLGTGIGGGAAALCRGADLHAPALHPEGDPRRAEVDIGILGMPWDGATSNRPGARHGPRGLRDASTMIRAMHGATRQTPFKTMQCADMGDVAMSPVDQDDALAAAEAAVAGMLADGIRPVMVGGDHLCTLTVLRALRKHRGEAFGLVLLDSHTDLYPPYFGGKTLTHGNPFRQAIEEGCLDPHRVLHGRDARDLLQQGGYRLRSREGRAYRRDRGLHGARLDLGDGGGARRRGRSADLCELRHRLHRSRPTRPAPARRRWAGPRVSRPCNACGPSGGWTSSGRTWWRFRRPSILRGGRAGWARRCCSS